MTFFSHDPKIDPLPTVAVLRSHLLSDTLKIYLRRLIEHLPLSPDFKSLDEAYSWLKDGKVDGIMEEMFTAVEFIQRKNNSELSIAQFFEDKHGFGAAVKKTVFFPEVVDCLSKLTKFVSDDIYFNASVFIKSGNVSRLNFYTH